MSLSLCAAMTIFISTSFAVPNSISIHCHFVCFNSCALLPRSLLIFFCHHFWTYLVSILKMLYNKNCMIKIKYTTVVYDTYVSYGSSVVSTNDASGFAEAQATYTHTNHLRTATESWWKPTVFGTFFLLIANGLFATTYRTRKQTEKDISQLKANRKGEKIATNGDRY